MMKFNTRILAVSLVLVGAVIIASRTVLFMGFLKRFFHLNNESSATVTRGSADWANADYLFSVHGSYSPSLFRDVDVLNPKASTKFILQFVANFFYGTAGSVSVELGEPNVQPVDCNGHATNAIECNNAVRFIFCCQRIAGKPPGCHHTVYDLQCFLYLGITYRNIRFALWLR